MKVKDLLNDFMAEKEVSVEKDGEGSMISYEGLFYLWINVNVCFSDEISWNWSVISWIYFSEISRDTESTFKKMIKEVSKAPAPKQIGIGAAAGWMSGYVMMKVGKAAATGKQTF